MIRKTPQPLARRIIGAMLIMAVLVASSYCLALWYGITATERVLIGTHLAQIVERVEKDPLHQRTAVSVLYAEGDLKGGLPAIPAQYQNLPEGFSEVLADTDDDLFVYKKTANGTTWVVEQSQYGFEELEIKIYLQALIGLMLALVAAIAIGWWLARSVTNPVKALAREVQLMAEKTSFQPSRTVFANDEVGQLAKIFEKTYKHLLQVLAREKAFTADVSHELRTPLTVIATSTELLLLKEHDESSREQLLSLQRANVRLSRLVRVFLQLARGKEHRQITDPRPLRDVVQDVITLKRAAAHERDLTLNIVDELSSPRAVNPDLTFSVLDNLIRNAMQYTKQGGITVTLRDTSLSVADTGCGIADEEKEKILDAFVRGKLAAGEGYGWGLTLVRRICEHEDWTLSFEKNHPRGTIFTVSFDKSQDNDRR